MKHHNPQDDDYIDINTNQIDQEHAQDMEDTPTENLNFLRELIDEKVAKLKEQLNLKN